MNKQTVYVPVSVEDELPKETNKRYGIIIEGSDCIDSAIYTRFKTWTNLGTAKVTHWLSPRQAVILDDEEVEKYEKMEQENERLKGLVIKAYDAGLNYGERRNMVSWREFKRENNLQ